MSVADGGAAPTARPATALRRADYVGAMALWLAFVALFALTSSGRIDTIDAQYKYEVAASLTEHGDPRIRDPWLLTMMGPDVAPYASYPLGASLVGLPLAAIGLWLDPSSRDLSQFLFSLSGAFFGALVPSILFLVWRRLRVASLSAAGWAAAVGAGSVLWPISSSSFDQPHQAALVLLSVLAAARAVSRTSARWAVTAGFLLGLVLHIQPAHVILLAGLGLAILLIREPDQTRTFFPRVRLAGGLVLGALPTITALAAYNLYRFESILTLTSSDASAPKTGNPLLGLLILLVSPGKGIIFYSPLLLIAPWGARELLRRARPLGILAFGTAALNLGVMASTPFPAGDWCWGPRYLVVLLPLVALTLPFAGRRLSRRLSNSVLAISIAIQVLALTLDHQRFFFERNLARYFWVRDPQFYFRESQLFARFGELARQRESPVEFVRFSSAPSPLLTYAPFGPPAPLLPVSHRWVRQFAVFYVPRPWILWMLYFPAELRPADPILGTLVLLVAGLGGVLVIFRVAKRDRSMSGRTPDIHESPDASRSTSD